LDEDIVEIAHGRRIPPVEPRETLADGYGGGPAHHSDERLGVAPGRVDDVEVVDELLVAFTVDVGVDYRGALFDEASPIRFRRCRCRC